MASRGRQQTNTCARDPDEQSPHSAPFALQLSSGAHQHQRERIHVIIFGPECNTYSELVA